MHDGKPGDVLRLCHPLCSAVVFFGRRKMEESVKWMGAFWTSIAGGRGHMTGRCELSMHSSTLALVCLMHGLLNALPTTVTQPVVSLQFIQSISVTSVAMRFIENPCQPCS
jgi:hypothetical protein